jgi:signal transduction histidine kinase
VISKAIGKKIPLLDECSGLLVYADPMLEKVFSNLLDNTVRHSEGATAVHTYYRTTDEGVTLIWEDNGVGISYDKKEKIFIRGFGKNTGLGLFLAREILDITGIAIHETGKPGEGARFEIVVPKGMYRTMPEP